MDIKEIALKAGYSTVPAYWLSDEKPIACSTSNFEKLVSFTEALIESYKAELLKEVWEPVGYHYLPNNEMFPAEEVSRSNLKNNPQDYVFLYTSDQLAAAQEQIERYKASPTVETCRQMIESQAVKENKILFDQLAKAEQRVAEWQPISTAPKDGQLFLAYSTEFVNRYWVTDKCNGMTHWMPLPKAPNGASS